MVDMAFDLDGGFVPKGYPFALWRELINILPWLETEPMAGVMALRGSASGEGMLLPLRAKLVLRLPAERAQQATLLSGHKLEIEGHALSVGMARARLLQPHPTLHAHLVENAGNEEAFLNDIADQLRQMNIVCKWICGKRGTLLGGGHSLSGYSLVLHDLKPQGSLQLQCMGLGGNRRFGCGIFVPYKVISGLE